MTVSTEPDDVALEDLRLCFEGAVPAVVATASAGGTPNVTYLSRVRMVDAERIALSNQFFSKTARNLAENPRASLLLLDPTTYEEYRLRVTYERTERRGPVFERLRDDLEAVAALTGMTDVFKLRAADIYRVQRIDRVQPMAPGDRPRPTDPADVARLGGTHARLAELSMRLSRCTDLDSLVGTTVNGLAELFGYEHSLLLLLDEDGECLYTIASHGYDEQGVGSEVALGEGIIGAAAARVMSVRVGAARQMNKYARSIQRSFEAHGGFSPGREIDVPGLPDAESRVAVPALARGELVGALMVETRRPVAYHEADEATLTVIASLVANAIEAERAQEQFGVAEAPADAEGPVHPTGPSTLVRFFPVDGSTFIDGDYLIKGVAGRILWSLLGCHEQDGRVEFTNREVRLDPMLELPEFRDNFESRLILLKRRLAERAAPIQIEKTGRGRFRLSIEASLRLESVGPHRGTAEDR